jgi:hypothetical protein
MLFALSRVQAKRGDEDLAFETLVAANRVAKQAHPGGARPYMDTALKVISAFDADMLARTPQTPEVGAGLVFVIGMPRSGTSLVEQILARHDRVTGIGESDVVLQTVTALENERKAPFHTFCHDHHPETLDQLGRTIERAMRDRAPEADVIVDKTPLNFLFAGLIHLALPAARIVHTRRDLRDTGLSCYEQYFTSGQEWSFDLADIGHYAAAYRSLMNHWGSQLADEILDLDYETLVSDPDNTIRALLAHCALDFQEACLTPERSSHVTHTASAAQVREPIHTRSIGKWQRHEHRLRPLLEALDERPSPE